ncbi:alpha/beta fold hydrolase [Halobacteriovorax sp. HLS]|uniref:alpha/beta fold hydrolase n=1 Tax=Halobacteriovorax sp. HLS TaxID=2234000 RepID=UPI000FDB972B|nr:alpha/beta fold hydrolase [Halobacteriovorax sp. HLS]
MIKDLLDSDHLFIEKEKLSYRDFYKLCLENAHTISNRSKLVSIQVTNDLQSLIDIFSLWIIGKEIILYSAQEPQSSLLKYNKELGATPIEKNGNHFNNTLESTNSLLDTACYIFTSGSTSRPVAIPLSFENLFSSADQFNDFYHVEHGHYLPITLPLYHIGGLMIAMRVVRAKASLDLCQASNMKEAEFSRRPSFLSVVPLQLDRILNSTEKFFFKDTIFILGGAKTKMKILEEIQKNNFLASSTYGMTETSAMCFATEVTSSPEVLESVGKPLRETTCSISKNGTLVLSGKCISSLFPNGKIQTKDLVRIDEHGNYHIQGRADDVFISGGENINPHEIEETLFNNGVKEAYIIGVEDEKFQHVSVLFYDDSFSESEIISLCKKTLHPHKVPRHFFKLERCTQGIKVKKSNLHKMAQALILIKQKAKSIPFITAGDPEKDWIIFLHGFMGQKEDWLGTFEFLKDDFFLIALDCPGHGDYLQDDQDYIQDFISNFCNFIRELKRPIHLVGYSQGARLALSCALKGLNLSSLVLESGSIGIVDEDERKKRLASDQSMFKNIKTKEQLYDFLDYWYSNPIFGTIKSHPDFISMLKNKLKHNPKYWQDALNVFSVGNQADFRDKMKNLSMPRLTITGVHDHKYYAQSKELETKFGFAFTPITDASHNTHLQRTEQFSNALKIFLSSTISYKK